MKRALYFQCSPFECSTFINKKIALRLLTSKGIMGMHLNANGHSAYSQWSTKQLLFKPFYVVDTNVFYIVRYISTALKMATIVEYKH